MKFSFWIDDGEVMNESDLAPNKGCKVENVNFARAAEDFLACHSGNPGEIVEFIAFCHDNNQWATGEAEQMGWDCLDVSFTSFDELLKKVG